MSQKHHLNYYPLPVQQALTGHIVNMQAVQQIAPKLYYLPTQERAALAERGIGGTDLYRYVVPDVIFEGDTPKVAKMYKIEFDYLGSIGLTTFGSAAYSPGALKAMRYLDERGEMSIRTGWGYLGPDYSQGTLETMASLVGTGTDYMWLVGAWAVKNGGSCTTINAKPEVKARENCNFSPPGSEDFKETGYQQMYDMIKSGLRVATMHSGGDKDIDQYMDIIEKASADAGMTLDEIRAKRHTFDHLSLAPRPGQLDRLKKLGMMTSGNPMYVYNTAPDVAKDYGEEYTAWIDPRKNQVDAGIMSSLETDTPLSQHEGTIFEVAVVELTRRSMDGKVHSPNMQMDRERVLKSMTTWGAYYLIREKLLGSLEPGKLADMIIIDRDYLTIPEEEVGKIQVLATMVGGKFVYAGRDFATENGMSPVGYQRN